MASESRIDELLSRYEAARREGQTLTPEELCAGDTDLLGELRRRVADLEAVDALLRSEREPARAEPAAPAAPKVVLEVLEGPHRDTRLEFDRHDTFIVGRARTAHLSLPDDPYFSRHHFLLELQPPRCYLRDLASRNGTLVNGAKVKETFLKDGDVIGGGRTRIRLTVEGAAAPAAGPLACTVCGSVDPAAQATPPLGPPGATPHVCATCRQALRDEPLPVPGYQILRKLGQGGMGVVYLARHGPTGRPVALKLIVPRSAASERAVQTFLREVSVLSRLEHPRIVRFYEVGTTRGQVFFAMEYVKAVPLGDLLAGLAPAAKVRTACGVLCQALAGLDYAHTKGFVHRDIKPANLLVSRAGRKLRVKVADFGLAKDFQNSGFSGLTMIGDACGSLPFIPPEQLLDCRGARPPADIYGAGATLYTLLAGVPPREFPSDKDPYAVILDEDIVPLAQRRPDLPAGLADVVHRALAREPCDRYPSAAAMRKALVPYARAAAPGG
jgi:eukaryotic-like serine/threonine-protein kinase